MSLEREILVEQKFATRKKSKGIAYLLLLLLGAVGGHRFYLGSPLSAVAMFFCWLAYFLHDVFDKFMTNPFNQITLDLLHYFFVAFWMLWCVVDLFLIPSMTDKYNSKVLNDIRLDVLRLQKHTDSEI
ncbi:TM2 domain-containing protein [Acinetobacter sp. B5B]|uniref:NINE protein n=1 Tax=Acinetobacter baretiae TaxID=2605383 RepID=UPI0018C29883|nr:TM2 domain-containing protein [Acinetobacter baretiae]MBF7683522.1 TM2 domain-containing protein [Acinetobacter baretiae]